MATADEVQKAADRLRKLDNDHSLHEVYMTVPREAGVSIFNLLDKDRAILADSWFAQHAEIDKLEGARSFAAELIEDLRKQRDAAIRRAEAAEAALGNCNRPNCPLGT